MKKALLTILFLIIFLTAFLIVKTLLYKGSNSISIELIEEEVSEGAIARFQGGIQIPTISLPLKADTAVFLSFHKYLEDQFPLVHSHLEKEIVNSLSLIYEWKGANSSKEPILFLAHMDVVPIQKSVRSNWNFDPFSSEIQDGYILGRGTMDDKGSLISILEATESLLAKGYTPSETRYFAFGHDEELGGEEGAIKMVEHFKNQKQKFSYIIDEGLVVVTDGLSGISKPIALIGLAEKGAMSLTLRVDLENGGHTMMPPKETAITILSDALVKIKDNPPGVKFNECVEQMFDEIGPEMKWPERIFFANQWLFRPLIARSLSKSNAANALIKTTLAPTVIEGGIMDNVLPSRAEAIINVRIIPGETVESVLDYVTKTIKDDRVELLLEAINKPRNPTFISPTDHFGFRDISKSISEVFGDVIIAPGLVIGGTDSRHFSGLSNAIYRFMPVMVSNKELEGIHGVNERVSIENYKNMVKFYTRLIKNGDQESQ